MIFLNKLFNQPEVESDLPTLASLAKIALYVEK